MISDIELIGEDGQPVSRPVAPGGPAAGTDPEEPAGRRRAPARSWAWALGGAVAASALWAGGLYAYTSREPDLNGYRASDNLCADAAMPELTGLYGERSGAEQTGRKDPAMDKAHCWFSFPAFGKPAAEEEPTGSVQLTYTLHRRTDPEPQFDASVAAEELNESEHHKLVRIQGLGERAYWVKNVHNDVPALYVLDGQATLSMHIHSPRSEDGPVRPADVARLEAIMQDDMRALMEQLQSGGR
ncbi:hypothetical protein [Streptomyces sp. NPDC014894]|uniref:hypothetical protein n=1 Tax=Streptomyces sp. NPDC014894 TaxID=3364931 RepID=UPI00370329A4